MFAVLALATAAFALGASGVRLHTLLQIGPALCVVAHVRHGIRTGKIDELASSWGWLVPALLIALLAVLEPRREARYGS